MKKVKVVVLLMVRQKRESGVEDVDHGCANAERGQCGI